MRAGKSERIRTILLLLGTAALCSSVVSISLASSIVDRGRDCRICHEIADDHHINAQVDNQSCFDCHSLNWDTGTSSYYLTKTTCTDCHNNRHMTLYHQEQHTTLIDDCGVCHQLVWDNDYSAYFTAYRCTPCHTYSDKVVTIKNYDVFTLDNLYGLPAGTVPPEITYEFGNKGIYSKVFSTGADGSIIESPFTGWELANLPNVKKPRSSVTSAVSMRMLKPQSLIQKATIRLYVKSVTNGPVKLRFFPYLINGTSIDPATYVDSNEITAKGWAIVDVTPLLPKFQENGRDFGWIKFRITNLKPGTKMNIMRGTFMLLDKPL